MLTYEAYNFTGKELKFIQDVLQDKRAWNVDFRRVLSNGDFSITLIDGDWIDKTYPSYIKGLSVTDSTGKKPRVYINETNWNTIPVKSGYTNLNYYRTYLILHEVGHVLGHGHSRCTTPGPAPVMMQQTKGTNQCYPDPWVIKK